MENCEDDLVRARPIFYVPRRSNTSKSEEPKAAGVVFGGPLSAFPSVRNQRRNTIQVARALDKGVYQLGAQA